MDSPGSIFAGSLPGRSRALTGKPTASRSRSKSPARSRGRSDSPTLLSGALSALPGRGGGNGSDEKSVSADSADSDRPIPHPPPPPRDTEPLSPISPVPLSPLALPGRNGSSASTDVQAKEKPKPAGVGGGGASGRADRVGDSIITAAAAASNGIYEAGDMPAANPTLAPPLASNSTFSSTFSASTSASFSQDDCQASVRATEGEAGNDGSGARTAAGDVDANASAHTNASSDAIASASASASTTSASDATSSRTDEHNNNLVEFVALYGMNDSVFAHTTDSSGNAGGRGSGGAADDDRSSVGERFSEINVHSSLHGGTFYGSPHTLSNDSATGGGRNPHHRDGVLSGGKSMSGDSGDPSIPSRPTLHFTTWLGEPLEGRLLHTYPMLPTGTEEDEKFKELQAQQQIFAFPQGVKVVSKRPPEPTYHSWVWTNYWEDGLTTTYYHCATLWVPVDESKLSLIKLREGAALLANMNVAQNDGALDHENGGHAYLDEDECIDAHERLRQLETLFEPQVLCIVTKVPYHVSFEKVLRAFVDPIYHETCQSLVLDDLVALEALLRHPTRPPASQSPPTVIEVNGVACSMPQPEAVSWELEYGARCLEADMAPLFANLQPSSVIKLYTHVMLERSVLIVSSHHELLFPCLESLKAMIFPLSWNHLYMPVMSTTMSQQLQVPFPYLAGVSKCEEVFDNIKLENSVVCDLDDDVVMEAYDYLSKHLQRDITYDIRVENYSERVENSETIGEKEKRENYACFPPRYAIELHQKINRYAPLYASKWGPHRPMHAVDLPLHADDNVRRCAHDQIQHSSTRPLDTDKAVGASGLVGGWQWHSGVRRGSQNGGPVADLTLRMWGVLDDSMEEESDDEEEEQKAGRLGQAPHSARTHSDVRHLSTMTMGVSASPTSAKRTTGFFSSSGNSSGPIEEEERSSAPLSRTWDGSSPLSQAVAANSHVNETHRRSGSRGFERLGIATEGSTGSHRVANGATPEGSSRGGGGGGGGSSGLRLLLSDSAAVTPSPTLSSVTGATTPSPLGSPRGVGSSSASAAPHEIQQAQFYSLRKAFFGVLQKLLKRYREYIRTPPVITDGGAAEEKEGPAGVAAVDDDGKKFETFDVAGFVEMSKPLCREFLNAFLRKGLFENYMHSRIASTDSDALDRIILEKNRARAFKVSMRGASSVTLGVAWKAKTDSSHSVFGPRGWNARLFELHHDGLSKRRRDKDRDRHRSPNSSLRSLRSGEGSGSANKSGSSGEARPNAADGSRAAGAGTGAGARVGGEGEGRCPLGFVGGADGSGRGGAAEGSGMGDDDIQRMINDIGGGLEERNEGGRGHRHRTGGSHNGDASSKEHARKSTSSVMGSPKTDPKRLEQDGDVKRGGSDANASASASANENEEMLTLMYYENVDELQELAQKITEALKLERSIRDDGLRAKSRSKREQMALELKAKKKRSIRGEFQLIKGQTRIVVPESNSSTYPSNVPKYAFEIHAQHDKRTKILTICCDSKKDRVSFIETLKHALLRKSDIERLQGYLTEEQKGRIRAYHSAMEQQRRENTTKNIVQRYPAPFVAKDTRKGSHLRSSAASSGWSGQNRDSSKMPATPTSMDSGGRRSNPDSGSRRSSKRSSTRSSRGYPSSHRHRSPAQNRADWSRASASASASAIAGAATGAGAGAGGSPAAEPDRRDESEAPSTPPRASSASESEPAPTTPNQRIAMTSPPTTASKREAREAARNAGLANNSSSSSSESGSGGGSSSRIGGQSASSAAVLPDRPSRSNSLVMDDSSRCAVM